MFHSHLIRRTFQIGACGAAILLCAVPGQSEPEKAPKGDKAACKVAYKAAQEREQSSHLREAKELYLACSKVICGAFMRPECTTKYTQLQSDVPSVIPVVTDEAGAVKPDVQVKMDGELLTSRLDGRALPVDPGMHEFTFATDAGVIATEKIMIVAGQRNSPIAISLGKRGRTLAASVTLPAPAVGNRSSLEPRATTAKPSTDKAAPPKMESDKAPPVEEEPEVAGPQPRRGGPGVVPYIVGGAGLAAVGAGALFTLWGKKDNDALGQCSPDCLPSSVQHVRTMYTIADISIGVGAAALGVSAFLLATSGSSSKERAPAKTAYSVDVQPTKNGAFATVSGAF
jgi:hypothetical protein